MHIVVAGGTGFIGRALCASLYQAGNRVTLPYEKEGRGATIARPRCDCRRVGWRGGAAGAWERCLEGADAVDQSCRDSHRRCSLDRCPQATPE